MKSRIARGFNFLAPFYDVLARLIIGKDIVNAQLHFLGSFKQCNRLLIIAGGSGWILDSLCTAYPHLYIDYIDLSPGMIKAANKKSGENKHVNFIVGTEDDIPDRLYDGVITNFYLDMFSERNLSKVIHKIGKSLNHSALWIVTDFISRSTRHKLMLWCMYRFFRLITRIEATHLPDWQNEMICSGYILVEGKEFKKGFIKSNVYQSSILSE